MSAIDSELLEHKTRTLHGLICWSVEHANNAPLPQPFASALGVAVECAKGLVALSGYNNIDRSTHAEAAGDRACAERL